MARTAVTPTFSGRGHLNRVLTYRPQVKLAYFLGFFGAALMGTSSLALMARSLWADGAAAFAREETLWLTLNLVLSVLVFFLAERGLKPRAFSRIQVSPGRVTIESESGRTEIPYDEIERISFFHFPYTAGWFRLHLKDGTRHRFTVALERSDYILDSVLAHRPELADREQLLEYRRAAVLSDHSLARIYSKLARPRRLLLKYLVWPFVLASVLWGFRSGPEILIGAGEFTIASFPGTYFLAAALNLALGLMNHSLLQESWLSYRSRRSLRARPEFLRRDTQAERKARFWSDVLHVSLSLAGLAALILVTR